MLVHVRSANEPSANKPQRFPHINLLHDSVVGLDTFWWRHGCVPVPPLHAFCLKWTQPRRWKTWQSMLRLGLWRMPIRDQCCSVTVLTCHGPHQFYRLHSLIKAIHCHWYVEDSGVARNLFRGGAHLAARPHPYRICRGIKYMNNNCIAIGIATVY